MLSNARKMRLRSSSSTTPQQGAGRAAGRCAAAADGPVGVRKKQPVRRSETRGAAQQTAPGGRAAEMVTPGPPIPQQQRPQKRKAAPASASHAGLGAAASPDDLSDGADQDEYRQPGCALEAHQGWEGGAAGYHCVPAVLRALQEANLAVRWVPQELGCRRASLVLLGPRHGARRVADGRCGCRDGYMKLVVNGGGAVCDVSEGYCTLQGIVSALSRPDFT